MNDNTHTLPPRRLSVAPMLDWTDRHYRYMVRQITRNTWLYSEMVNAGAIVYGDKDRFLMFNEGEQPVALQLGGSDPSDLAKAAKAGQPQLRLPQSARAERFVRRVSDERSRAGCRLPQCDAGCGAYSRYRQTPNRRGQADRIPNRCRFRRHAA